MTDDAPLALIRRIDRTIPGPNLDDETLAHIRRIVAEAPPFTVEQIAILRSILGPGSEPDPGQETTPNAA